MKIKCIIPNAEEFDLTCGKVYDVENISHNFLPYTTYHIMNDSGGGSYMKGGEFEVVEEQPSEWDGKGLPPVGTVCEMMSPILGMWAEQWLKVEILAIKGDVAIGWCKDKNIAVWNCVKGIRPIKSEKQKEIDKIASELLESVNKNGEDFRHLEWEIAEHLYNAGLRFTKDSK